MKNINNNTFYWRFYADPELLKDCFEKQESFINAYSLAIKDPNGKSLHVPAKLIIDAASNLQQIIKHLPKEEENFLKVINNQLVKIEEVDNFEKDKLEKTREILH